MLRHDIVDALSTMFSVKVAKAYENEIYKMCSRMTKDNIDEVYNIYAYEKVGEILSTPEKEDRKDIVRDILNNRVKFDSVKYKLYRDKRQVENDRFVNPPEVKQGIYKCKKCGSKKTWSYQLQTRSADEGFTNFVTCSNCGNKWKFS